MASSALSGSLRSARPDNRWPCYARCKCPRNRKRPSFHAAIPKAVVLRAVCPRRYPLPIRHQARANVTLAGGSLTLSLTLSRPLNSARPSRIEFKAGDKVADKASGPRQISVSTPSKCPDSSGRRSVPSLPQLLRQRRPMCNSATGELNKRIDSIRSAKALVACSRTASGARIAQRVIAPDTLGRHSPPVFLGIV